MTTHKYTFVWFDGSRHVLFQNCRYPRINSMVNMVQSKFLDGTFVHSVTKVQNMFLNGQDMTSHFQRGMEASLLFCESIDWDQDLIFSPGGFLFYIVEKTEELMVLQDPRYGSRLEITKDQLHRWRWNEPREKTVDGVLEFLTI